MLTAVGLAFLLVTLAAAPVLERRRRRARDRRTGAELRVALLETARTLPGHELPEAARLACEGLLTLGFDAAAVSVRRGRVVVPLHSVGLPQLERPIPAEGSFAGRCLDENRTLVVADYASLPTRRPERADLRSVVLTPVRADGRPVATLNAARRRVDEPRPQEIAIAETVAAHLGRVFATQARVAAQDQLVERMRRLDEMRSTFVEQVSDELRDRLGTLRELAATLPVTADGGERHDDTLAEIIAHAAVLGTTIDTMLDFSRFQVDRPAPSVEPVAVADLLVPLRRSGILATASPLAPLEGFYVNVDVGLVRHALELLLSRRSDAVPVALHDDGEHVHLVLSDPAAGAGWRRGDLVVSLVEQLLLAGGAGLLVEDELAVVLPRWGRA